MHVIVRIEPWELATAVREYLRRRGIAVKDDTKVRLMETGSTAGQYAAEVAGIEQPVSEGPYR